MSARQALHFFPHSTCIRLEHRRSVKDTFGSKICAWDWCVSIIPDMDSGGKRLRSSFATEQVQASYGYKRPCLNKPTNKQTNKWSVLCPPLLPQSLIVLSVRCSASWLHCSKQNDCCLQAWSFYWSAWKLWTQYLGLRKQPVDTWTG